tara:strand:+ start:868 stop:1293 length:426 start_codon:yes stop_codon:yes gene_type:complete
MDKVQDSLHTRQEKLEKINTRKLKNSHETLFESNFDHLEKKYKYNEKFLKYLRNNREEMEKEEIKRENELEKKRVERRKRIEELQKMKLSIPKNIDENTNLDTEGIENNTTEQEEEPLFDDNRTPPVDNCCSKTLRYFNIL